MSSRIPTYTGKMFDLRNPTSEMIDIRDIAHALSYVTRFTGQTNRRYSVAEHSVHVSWLVKPRFALAALLHDAAEAYIGDLSSPLKRLLGSGLVQIESRIQKVIDQKFGVDRTDEVTAAVKLADRIALDTEARDLMAAPLDDWEERRSIPDEQRIIPLPMPQQAELRFSMRFVELACDMPVAQRIVDELDALLQQVGYARGEAGLQGRLAAC